jgi:hypothetical protein
MILRRCWPLLAVLFSTGAARSQDQPYPPGVNKEIHEAIQRGLDFLARSQANDGCWRNAGGYGSYPAAMTGLAGMALIASGSTPTRGKFWSHVRRSVEFLVNHADASSGVISVASEEGRSMYGHGFSLLYLASVYGMEEDVKRQEKLHPILSKAVKLIENSQSGAGGWLYTPDSGGDEGSVTVTQVQALRACRMAGILVSAKTIDRAINYIKKCQNSDGGIKYSAGSGGESRPAISAAGVAVLYNAGVYDDQPFVGGKDWDEYFAKMSGWLLKQQRKDGSWDGDGVGSVYGTAIALIILQLPYALAPILQR